LTGCSLPQARKLELELLQNKIETVFK
jgi:hypothetical protein